jgi:hypothetical protein
MSSAKALAWSVLVWGALVPGTAARADALSGFGGWNLWQAWGPVRGTNANLALPFLDTGATPPPALSLGAPATPTLTTSNAAPAIAAPQFSTPAPSVSSPPSSTYNAFINMGTGAYPEANFLTTGGAQPWYNSPVVQTVFGGTPTLQQQTSFENAVLQDVQTTYHLSGINLNVTLDPNASAAHTISVVSGTSYPSNPGVIGITDVGNNGFSFIDNLKDAQAGQINDLEWALAHNISHELMHALGVAVHHDQTGQYLDAASASWSLLTNPSTVFSSAAVTDIQSHLNGAAGATGTGAELIDGDQEILPQPIPEPSTITVWVLGAVGTVIVRYRRKPVIPLA